MPAQLRAHLTYANVVATLALFVALGGTSYATLKVTGRDVKNNSLTGRDIRSLTSADVRDRTLGARDLAPGVMPAQTRFVARSSQTFGSTVCEGPCPESAEVKASAECEPGERATGGGVAPLSSEDGVDRGSEDVSVRYSRPIFGGDGTSGSVATGWEAGIRYSPRRDATAMFDPVAYVICASP